MKNRVFERGLDLSAERVVLILYKSEGGFILERQLIERDQTVSVQILPIIDLRDLYRFERADPYSEKLAPLYYEVQRHLRDNRLAE
ncbi:hypothetical protein [Paraburkholderia susongensis]|uniref:Uncharacterized protein n=1 Tax=Paraburkholderia susongensis TaxID=1515439 RepID=A0A1X7M6Y6_9BURK|nr:hypothetical protein [Paraburkholderia susongensis]SMG61263.1 hypothetical protein SAMN06265784_12060 [Paraburkholderia susongensis]